MLIKLHLNVKGELLDWDVIGTSEQRDFISKILSRCIGWSILRVPFRISLVSDQPSENIEFPSDIIILQMDEAYDK